MNPSIGGPVGPVDCLKILDASAFERYRAMISILLEDSTSKSIAPAIRWLIRAKICKKKPQTETKSLAFGSVKELLDCHLEHIEGNSQTQEIVGTFAHTDFKNSFSNNVSTNWLITVSEKVITNRAPMSWTSWKKNHF